MPRVSNPLAYLLAATSMVIYSSPPVVTRFVSADVPPLVLALSRWLIAGVILLPFAWRRWFRQWPELRGHLPSLTWLATFMVFGTTMSVLAVYYTSATNAVLVNASQPAVTAMLGFAIAGTVLTGRQRLGIVCAFLGIVVMIARADFEVLLGLEFNIGDFIMLLAVLGWSAYAVQLPRRGYAPDAITLMFLICVVGTLLLAPVALIESAVVGGFDLGRGVVSAMLYLAIFPTLLATLCWNLAIGAVGTNRAAIFVNLIPVSGAALAMAFLGESLYVYHLAGAVLVLSGVWLAARR